VVEGVGELSKLLPRKPARLRGIVAASGMPANRSRFVEDRDVVSAWIAIGLGIDAK